MTNSNRHIVIDYDPDRGPVAYGPFGSYDAAVEWADENGSTNNTVIPMTVVRPRKKGAAQ